MATIVVSNSLDVVNGNTSSIFALVADDGEDGISLREAVIAADNTFSHDEIRFDPAVFNGEAADVIRLELGQLNSNGNLHIDGGILDVVISGDANGDDELVPGTFVTDVAASQKAGVHSDNVRVIQVSSGGRLELTGVTLTGGSASGSGGAIFAGEDYYFFGNLILNRSSISGNYASVDGGGIQSFAPYGGGSVSVSESTISGNVSGRSGGGFSGYTRDGAFSFANSTISGNSSGSIGGGIDAHTRYTTIRVTGSTISGNSSDGRGGGAWLFGQGGAVVVTNTTVSGNTGRDAGGFYARSIGSGVFVSESTITGNTATDEVGGMMLRSRNVRMYNSIVAGNNDDGTAPDFDPYVSNVTTFMMTHSLVGDKTGTPLRESHKPTVDGNLIGGSDLGVIDPMLEPLSDNGGSTLTHALLVGSPAIDAADPLVASGFDQRGLSRVVGLVGKGERMDIGAVEMQSAFVQDRTFYVFGRGEFDDVIALTKSPAGVSLDFNSAALGPVRAATIDTIQIEGYSGDDTINVNLTGGSTQNTIVNSGEGDDIVTVVGGATSEINGGAGNDHLTGGVGDDMIDGGVGNDFVNGGSGNDVLNGGSDDDLIFGFGGDDEIDGGRGDDELDGGSGNDFILGGNGNDVIQGSVGHDEIDGGLGNDDIKGGAGNDMMRGDVGDDRLSGDGGDDTIDGNNGNDVINGGADDDQINGGNGADRINGGNGHDEIDGGDDNDRILGVAGDDTIYGGDGHDILLGGDGTDSLNGEDGNDRIYGHADNDTLIGGPGIDMLRGGTGADVMRGGDGIDDLQGDGGDDQMFGDADNDVVNGGPGNDTLSGGSGDDTMDGGGGDDVLQGFSGKDMLLGNVGNDVLDGGVGDDVVNGGNGDDTIRGGIGDDSLIGHSGNDLLIGGNGDDSLNDSSGFNILIGGGGRDVLNGGDGSDLLIGAATVYDNNQVALDALMAEWVSNNSYVQRVNNIRDGSGTSGGGANGTTFLTSADIIHDAATDRLKGGAGEDYFWGNSLEVLDAVAGEFIDD